MNRRSNTGLLHPLSWYPKAYGIPEQTIVNAYKRGWDLDDPQCLLENLLRAPGPKSKGLQPLIDYVNGQQRPSAASRGSSRNAPKRKAESAVGKRASEQGDDPKKIFVELIIGDRIYRQLITPAEVDKIIRLNNEPWLNKSA